MSPLFSPVYHLCTFSRMFLLPLTLTGLILPQYSTPVNILVPPHSVPSHSPAPPPFIPIGPWSSPFVSCALSPILIPEPIWSYSHSWTPLSCSLFVFLNKEYSDTQIRTCSFTLSSATLQHCAPGSEMQAALQDQLQLTHSNRSWALFIFVKNDHKYHNCEGPSRTCTLRTNFCSQLKKTLLKQPKIVQRVKFLHYLFPSAVFDNGLFIYILQRLRST